MGTTNRYNWEFSYTSIDVLKGAQLKAAFANTRLSFWQKTKEDLKKKIKKEGMSFEETQSNTFSNYDRPTSVKIENSLLKDLQECNDRILFHQDSLKSYNGWIEVLKSQDDKTLYLTQDDWMYFFGTPGLHHKEKIPATVKKVSKPTTTKMKPGPKPKEKSEPKLSLKVVSADRPE